VKRNYLIMMIEADRDRKDSDKDRSDHSDPQDRPPKLSADHQNKDKPENPDRVDKDRPADSDRKDPDKTSRDRPGPNVIKLFCP
jgi:hypothetical protein